MLIHVPPSCFRKASKKKVITEVFWNIIFESPIESRTLLFNHEVHRLFQALASLVASVVKLRSEANLKRAAAQRVISICAFFRDCRRPARGWRHDSPMHMAEFRSRVDQARSNSHFSKDSREPTSFVILHHQSIEKHSSRRRCCRSQEGHSDKTLLKFYLIIVSSRNMTGGWAAEVEKKVSISKPTIYNPQQIPNPLFEFQRTLPLLFKTRRCVANSPILARFA